ncbi:unnamed protein product, partial [Ectocarpus sp. 12 AP-2014]
ASAARVHKKRQPTGFWEKSVVSRFGGKRQVPSKCSPVASRRLPLTSGTTLQERNALLLLLVVAQERGEEPRGRSVCTTRIRVASQVGITPTCTSLSVFREGWSTSTVEKNGLWRVVCSHERCTTTADR